MTSQRDLDYRQYFDSTYVRAWELPEGRDVTKTIERVERVQIGKDDASKASKIAIYFVDTKKPLVVNKTMGKTISRLYGNRVSAWVGKPITLYSTQVNAFGETHDVIRIRPTVAKARPRNDKPPARELPPAPIEDAEYEEQETNNAVAE